MNRRSGGSGDRFGEIWSVEDAVRVCVRVVVVVV